MAKLADRVDALLPQTQCMRCGYDGCRPYAEAVARDEAAINQCPPGGGETIAKLAELLGRAVLPLNPEHGVETEHAVMALIDESLCIGCFKCVLACPVDAIVGAPKYMHTVIATDCSGCELCLPPCPVNCISLVSRPVVLPTPVELAPRWRRLHESRNRRIAAERNQRDEARRRRRTATLKEQAQTIDIAAAIARARARKSR